MATVNTPSNATLLTAPQPAVALSGLTGGTSAQRPANPTLGQLYYDTTLGAEIVWNGTIWASVSVAPAQIPGFGSTSGRPTAPYNGQLYFNTTLGGLEGWTGSTWLYIGPIAADRKSVV